MSIDAFYTIIVGTREVFKLSLNMHCRVAKVELDELHTCIGKGDEALCAKL